MRLILGAVLLAACAPVRPPQAPTYTAAELVEQSRTFVVRLATDQDDGSGFVVAKDRVATSRHILGNAARAEIVLADGTRRLARGVWVSDKEPDLAVLDVDTSGLRALPLADSGTLRKGDAVVALGFGAAFAEIEVLAEGELPEKKVTPELFHTLTGAPGLNVHGQVVGVLASDVRPFARATPVNKLVPLAHASTPAQPLSVLAGPPRESAPRETALAGCEAGNMEACARLRKDAPEKARELLVRRCNGRSGAACTAAAEMTRAGEGGAANAARAQALFELACEQGEAEACAEVPRPKAPRRKR